MKMKWKELKDDIEDLGNIDDYEVEIVGAHSGSYGSPLKIGKTETKTPDGIYKEIQILIDS